MKKCKLALASIYLITICSSNGALAYDINNTQRFTFGGPNQLVSLAAEPSSLSIKSLAKSTLKSVGKFVNKEISKIIFAKLMDATGLKELIFGQDKTSEIQSAILQKLEESRISIEAVSDAISKNQNEIMAALATLDISNERAYLNQKITNMFYLSDTEEQNSNVMGFYYSARNTQELKKTHGKKFIADHRHNKIKEELLNLHSMYESGSYLDKLAKAYLLSAQASPIVGKISDVYQKFEDEYSRLAVYELQLLSLFVLNRTITLEVGDQVEKEQAEMDIKFFLPKWKEFARMHQRAYIKNVAMIAASVGSQYETLSWKNGSPQPMSQFSYELRDAGKLSNDILSMHDHSFERKKHFYLLAKEIDADSIVPPETIAQFVASDGVCESENTNTFTCSNPESYRRFYFETAKIDKIVFKTPSSFGFLKMRDSKATLQQSNRWVLYDFSYNSPLDIRNKPSQSWYTNLILTDSKSDKKIRLPSSTPCFEKRDDASCLFPVDARFSGPSSVVEDLPLELNESKYKTTWFSFNKSLKEDKLQFNHRAKAGEASDAGSDYFIKIPVILDQPFTGKVYGSSRVITKLLTFDTLGSNNWGLNNCTRAKGFDHFTLSRKIQLGHLNLTKNLTSANDLKCSKDNNFSFQVNDLGPNEVFSKFNDLAIYQQLQDWESFNLGADFSNGFDIGIQIGHNRKSTNFGLVHAPYTYIDLTAGLSSLNFFTPAKIGE